MVVYYYSISCSPCLISNLLHWSDIVTYSKELAYKFYILFIFDSQKHEQREIYLKFKELDYPFFMDEEYVFSRLNKNIPKDDKLHTFLLDKNNKVVLVGNPVDNAKLWDLYKKTINELIENGGEMKEQ